MANQERKYATFNPETGEPTGKIETFTFGPLPLGFMKRNVELMKKVCLRSGVEDLIEQEPVALLSLKAGMGKKAPESLDVLSIPDASDALFATMEASGFTFATKSPTSGEETPAGA